MVKVRLGIAAASVAVVAGGLLTAAVMGASSAGAVSSACVSSGKCYAAAVSTQNGQPIVAGLSQGFSFSVTNDATTQTLGSLQITVPTGFVITSATGAASYSANSALYLNLGLSPTHSTTLKLQATAPCSSTTPTPSWGVLAKQSNQFNGPNNGFVLDTTGNPLAAPVSGSCSLSFSSEPVGGVAGPPALPITSKLGQPATTSPVAVTVLAGDNKTPVTSSTAVITLTNVANPYDPTPAPLSGTTQVQAASGVALFSNLIISQASSFNTLQATSPGITSATSSFFNVWNQLPPCQGSGSQCTGSASNKNVAGTAITSSATSGQFVGVGLGGFSFSCGGPYQPLTDPLSFDVLDSGGTAHNALFTVTIEVSKQLVQASGHPGASTWQICFGSTVQFPAQQGTAESFTVVTPTGNIPYYTGLLLDCTNNTPANTPCVLSRNKDNAGNELVTFLGYGDMYGRT